MRKLYFLLPGTGSRFACGGLWAELRTVNLAKQICDAEVVTYRQRDRGVLFLDDVLRTPYLENVIFVVSWGFDIAKLIRRLAPNQIVYHAHSAGYPFRVPSHIPIIAVSRNTMGYWGQKSPNSLIYYLPNQIGDEFFDRHLERDIDVLVQARKSSEYLLDQLVPALQKQCNVHLVNSYVEDLAELFNRSRLYLYDSAEYWAQQKVSEGFGLQPLEAMACGCQVFSSLNSGLSDYLDPAFNCQKIAGYSTEYDVQRILQTLKTFVPLKLPNFLLDEYRISSIKRRLQVILTEINTFFDHSDRHPATIPDLTNLRVMRLSMKQIAFKLKRKCLTFLMKY